MVDKLAAQNKMDEAKKIQEVLDNEKRDIVIQLPVVPRISISRFATDRHGLHLDDQADDWRRRLVCDEFTQKDVPAADIRPRNRSTAVSRSPLTRSGVGAWEQSHDQVIRHQGTPAQPSRFTRSI
jgi:hypothetical protein